MDANRGASGAHSRVALGLVVLAVLGVLALGLHLRLEDPLSTRIIPAEDPYTHMALVREHLRDGSIDPLYEGSILYPPGMHALVAGAMAFTGSDLYDVVRFAPVFLGGIGILAIAFLVGRHEGVVAGLVAGLATAVAPEIIFRTTMMAPTALDLALLPIFFYAVLRVVQGRLAWLGALVPVAAFLLFAHPWVFGVLAVTGVLFVGLCLFVPWPASRGPRLSTLGTAAAMAVLGVGTALFVGGCGAWCGPGFGRVASGPVDGATLRRWIIIFTVVLSAILAIASRRQAWIDPAWPWMQGQARTKALILLTLALVGGLGAMTWVALQGGLPRFVSFSVMFGWPIMVMAAIGLALVPLARGPIPYLGAAIVLGTYPFVVFNPLQSEFWPHRTAVYLGLGLIILVGVAVGQFVRWGMAASDALRRDAATPQVRRSRRTTPWAITPAALLIPLIAAAAPVTAFVAATPDPYDGWYRLYGECAFEGIEEAAAIAIADPSAVMVMASWQSKVVVAAMADDISRIWYHDEFFNNSTERAGIVSWLGSEQRPLYVVLDKYTLAREDIDTTFVEGDDWDVAYASECGAASRGGAPNITIHVHEGAAP